MRIFRSLRKLPWRFMAKSPPFLATIGAILCHEISLAFVFVILPNYLRDAMHFDATANGLLCAIPIATYIISKFATFQLTDLIANFKRQDVIAKTLNAIAALGLGGGLIGASLLDCDYRILAVAVIAAGTACSTLQMAGALRALAKIVPIYVNECSSLTFLIVTFGSAMNPIILKLIVDPGTARQWHLALQIWGIIAVLPVCFFTLLGTTDVQPWAKPATKRRKKLQPREDQQNRERQRSPPNKF